MACWEDAAIRVLTGNQQPDHSLMSDFHPVPLDALAGLFVQVLRLCQKARLVSLVSLGNLGSQRHQGQGQSIQAQCLHQWLRLCSLGEERAGWHARDGTSRPLNGDLDFPSGNFQQQVHKRTPVGSGGSAR
jgi:hypothetical protein